MIEDIQLRWPDASVSGMSCDYEALCLRIQESGSPDQAIRKLRCYGYIGFQMVGFWDEVVIHDARIHKSHEFIAQCELRVADQLRSGSIERTPVGNKLLEIEMIDGCRLWVCAKRFAVDDYYPR